MPDQTDSQKTQSDNYSDGVSFKKDVYDYRKKFSEDFSLDWWSKKEDSSSSDVSSEDVGDGLGGKAVNVSEQVKSYQKTIEKYANKYNIEGYVQLLMAIMMQESGGRGNDPMQSGQSSPDASIDRGCSVFKNCLDGGKKYDMKTVIQGYNMGPGFCSYVGKNGGKFKQSLAVSFSNAQKAAHGYKIYGDVDYVAHVLRYYSGSLTPSESSSSYKGKLPGGLVPAKIIGGRVIIPTSNRNSYAPTIAKAWRADGFKELVNLPKDKFQKNLPDAVLKTSPVFLPILLLIYEKMHKNMGYNKILVNSSWRAMDPEQNNKAPDNKMHGWGGAMDIGCHGRKEALEIANIAWSLGLRAMAPVNTYIHVDCGPEGFFGERGYPPYYGPGKS